MNSDQIPLLESLLTDSGFATWEPPERAGLLAEDAARLVWVRTYASASELLEGWPEEQAWFVNYVGDRVSQEKSWELYLVLATALTPSPDLAPLLEMVRSDTAYARKILIPGLDGLTPSAIQDHLAVLRPLTLDVSLGAPDPFVVLEDAATAEGRDDVLEVLSHYRANVPLFGDSL